MFTKSAHPKRFGISPISADREMERKNRKRKNQARPMTEAVAISSSSSANETLPEVE